MGEIWTAFVSGARAIGAPALWGQDWNPDLAAQLARGVCEGGRSDDWAELVWAWGPERRLPTEEGDFFLIEIWARSESLPTQGPDANKKETGSEAHDQQEARLLYARECVRSWVQAGGNCLVGQELSLHFQALYSSTPQPEKAQALLEQAPLRSEDVADFLLVAAQDEANAASLALALTQLEAQGALNRLQLQEPWRRAVEQRCASTFWILARHCAVSPTPEQAIDWAQREAVPQCAPDEQAWVSREIARAQRQILLGTSRSLPASVSFGEHRHFDLPRRKESGPVSPPGSNMGRPELSLDPERRSGRL